VRRSRGTPGRTRAGAPGANGIGSSKLKTSSARRRAVAALASCAALAAAGPLQARETLIVAHDQWIGFSGFFVAQAQGYFAQEGLDVKEVDFSGPGDTLPPLLSGHVDIALTTLYNLALLAARGEAQARAIYLLDTSNGADAVVAAPSIRRVADLAGKNVGVTVGDVNQLLLRKALDAAGVREDQVHIVNMNADDAGAALLAHRIDAAVTWEPWVSRARSAGNNVIFSSADTPDLILDAVVVTRATAQARGAALTRFLRALDRGVAYLRAHAGQSQVLVGKALTVAPDAVAGMLAQDRIYAVADNRALLSATGAGPRSLAAIGQFLQSRALLRGALDPAALLSAQLLPAP